MRITPGNSSLPAQKRMCALTCRGMPFFSALILAVTCFAGAAPGGLIEKSGEWDWIQDGEYLVENCTWNVRAAHGKWQETIFCDSAAAIAAR